MSFPKYPAYKSSGIEWLEKVPEHWQLKPIKAVATFNDEVLPESFASDQEIEYVDIGSVSLLNGIEKIETIPFANAPSRARRKVRDGDVIVSTVRTYLKAIAPIENPPENLIVSTGFAVIRARNQVLPSFLRYALQDEYFIQQVISRSTGISYPAINSSEMACIPLAIPSEIEQKLIADFLDRETEKIDALIAEQQRLIELLQEKRQAVISHAVTKGLNPDAPMKDSGVEWLGQVPAHWEVKPCRRFANISRGASPRPAGDPEFFNGDFIPWVTVAEITKDERIELTHTEEYLTESGADRSKKFFAGTLLYSNSGATLGVPKILMIDCCANDGVVGFENLDQKIDIEFLYFFLSSLTKEIREWAKQGQGQPNLNTDIVKSIQVPVPPLNEQRDIVQAIKSESEEANRIVQESQQSLLLLQERRSALISAAVTGQIDVRGLAEAVE